MKPEPQYLQPGDVVELGIDGLGSVASDAWWRTQAMNEPRAVRSCSRQLAACSGGRSRSGARDHCRHSQGHVARVLAERARRRAAGGAESSTSTSCGAARCAKTIATRRSPKWRTPWRAACRASRWRRSTKSALVAPVMSARRSGVPVVIFDSGLKGGEFVSFVATDNDKGGELAGEHLAKTLGGSGKVILMRYAEGHDSTTPARRRIPARPQARIRAFRSSAAISTSAPTSKAPTSGPRRCSRDTRRRRHPRRRRPVRAERIERVRRDARAAGQRLGGQGAVHRLRCVRRTARRPSRRRHRSARRPGPGAHGLSERRRRW